MTDVLLCIGAGLLQQYLIHEARLMGFKVAATDRHAYAPGFREADVPLLVDTYDLEATRTVARQLQASCASSGDRLAGVVTCGADVSPTVSAAAEAVGLPALPLAVAQVTHHKIRVRETLDAAGLGQYQPRWLTATLRPDAGFSSGLLTRVERDIGWPCVVKPPEERASRGVRIVETPGEWAKATEYALTYSPTGEILYESSLQGTEHSVEFLFTGKDTPPCWFNVVDRPFSYAHGFPIELGHINPSALSLVCLEDLSTMGRAIASALNVTWGPFKMDVIWTDEGPKLLECTTRLSGGFDCQVTSPLTGRYPIRQLISLATGRALIASVCVFPDDEVPWFAACAAVIPEQACCPSCLPTVDALGATLDAPIPDERRILRSVRTYCGEATINLTVGDGLQHVVWTIAPGTPLPGMLRHNAQRPGYVFAVGATSRAAWTCAQDGAQRCARLLEQQGGA